MEKIIIGLCIAAMIVVWVFCAMAITDRSDMTGSDAPVINGTTTDGY